MFTAGPGKVFETKSAVSGNVVATVPAPMADVAAEVADKNGTLQSEPFRRFTTVSSGAANSAVLATTTVTINKKDMYNAITGALVTDAIVTGVKATATNAAPNFAAVSAADGGIIPSNRHPWMVSTMKTCMNGPMALTVKDGTINTYDADPDGKDGKRVKGDITPEGLAKADTATTLSSKYGDYKTGTGYLCLLAKDNENAIPRSTAPFMLKLEPQVGATNPFKPAAIGPKAAGQLSRNGTTVNLTYLSTHEAYNQRLVIVNRGSESAHFFVDDLQLEDGVMVDSNTLSGMVPGNGRLVTRVQDHLTLSGKTRAAATVNVVAPKDNIDVMTIQVHPGTGQIDTTMYEVE